MKKVSISDIARSAGVSVSTVSFVMNDKAVKMRISLEVIRKVERIAREMGYTPNQLARGLRTGKTRTIGLMVENIANSFFSTLAKAIEDEAKKYDYKVVYCSTDNDTDKARQLINMLSQRQVDGYIITPTRDLLEDIQKLQADNKPVVLVDRYFSDHAEIPHVLVDNYRGVSEGMEYLIAQGFRKIALVSVEFDMDHMKDRLQAYYDVLGAHGIGSDERFLKLIPYGTGVEYALQEMENFLSDLGNQIDAVFFLTNYLGVIGIEAIKKLGIQVPSGLAVLCFDDNDIFRLHTPGISVIRQPVREIGQQAILTLLDRLKGSGEKTGPGQINDKLPAKLVRRESA